MKCPECHGTGKQYWNGNVFINVGYDCPKCNGTGDVPMTEQEYIQTCNTEQLAEVLWEQINGAFNSGYAYCNLKQDKDYVGRYKKFVEWLKQPHKE